MVISIIVPVYNVEKYLRECLDSILAQTYKPLEVVLVDDGSTDRSGMICDEYAEKHDIFKVIHKKNVGLGMARNTGLENIIGEYVMFLDSDDYINATFVADLYKATIDNNVDMCKSGFNRVSDDKNIFKVIRYEDKVYEGDCARNELLPRMIGSRPDKKDSIEMAVCAVLYKSRIIKDNSIRFVSERQLISEDLVFNIDYLQHANGACTVSEVGYNYRFNPTSLCTSYRPDRFEACCRFYLEMKKKLEDLGYDQMTFLRLKRMFFIYLRMCLAQETEQVAGYSKKECLERITQICKSDIVQENIREYPMAQMGLAQKLFLKLVLGVKPRILYTLLKKNN